MKPPQTQTARLPDGPAYVQEQPFEALSHRAPFPRASAGVGEYGPRIELQLDAGSTAAAEARAAVGALDGRVVPGVLDDVRLLLSEIVTNSLRHSGAPSGAKIGLTVAVGHDRVRAEVTDGGRGFAPSPRHLPRLESGGWGLHVVDRLADRWGVDRGDAGRVWFEIACA